MKRLTHILVGRLGLDPGSRHVSFCLSAPALALLILLAPPAHAEVILHDFESGTEGFEDQGWGTALDSLAWSSDQASSGAHSLGIHCTFTFGPSDEFHVAEPESQLHDLSEAESLIVDVYFPEAHDFTVNITARVGIDQHLLMSPVLSASAGWNTFVWDIDGLEGRDIVGRIGLRVESFLADFSGFVYLDHIRADEAAAGSDTALVVTASADTVAAYHGLELTPNWLYRYDNPFDPEDVNVTAVFSSPTRTEWQVHGFWTGSDWKLRFAPDEVGEWSCAVTVDDDGSDKYSDTLTFYCTPSEDHGWLRVSDDNPRFLEHDDGTPFYGIGHCRCWNLEELGWSADGYQIFDDMEAHGMNLLALWLAPWDLMPVSLLAGADYDDYDMSRAAEVDDIVQDAERHGIRILFHIWDHNALRDATHSWGGGWWDANGFANLTDCPSFFTDGTSWSWQEHLYRYIIARWGYSRAIGMWGTICEIDGTNAYGNTDSWHDAIDGYFESNDPFGHPTTASKSGYQDWQGLNESTRWHAGYTAMDLPQLHTYKDTDDPVHIATVIVYDTRIMWDWYEKPVLIGEFGTDNEIHQPDHNHNGIWSGLVSGNAVTPLDWNDGGSWGDLSPEMFDHFLIFSEFVEDVPFCHLDLDEAAVSVSGSWLNCWGIADSTFGMGWIQDITPGEWVSGRTFTAAGLVDGEYAIEWWNTWNGSIVGRDTVAAASGTFETSVPDFLKDVACKFSRLALTGVADRIRPPHDPRCVDGFPNPAGETVTFRYSASRAGLATLDVYDIRGRRVSGLRFRFAAGEDLSVEWKTLGTDGRPLPSGVYYYRLWVEGRVTTGQVTVLR